MTKPTIRTETDAELDRDRERWTPGTLAGNERLAREASDRIHADPGHYGRSVVGLADICDHLAGQISREELARRLAG